MRAGVEAQLPPSALGRAPEMVNCMMARADTEVLHEAAVCLWEDAVSVEADVTKRLGCAVAGAPCEVVDAGTRIKTVGSLVGKLTRLTLRLPLEMAVSRVNDALRYRVAATPVGYAEAVTQISHSLQDGGTHLVGSTDMWGDSRYKGLNVTYRHERQLFEVQFHTYESHRVATSTEVRELYERARSERGPARRVIDRRLKELWSLSRPPGAWEL